LKAFLISGLQKNWLLWMKLGGKGVAVASQN